MAGKSRKRSAEGDLDNELGSPSNRSRVEEDAIKEEDAETDAVKQEEEGEEEQDGQQTTQAEEEEEEGEEQADQYKDDDAEMEDKEPTENNEEEEEQMEDANADEEDQQQGNDDKPDEEEEEEEEDSLPIRKVNVEGRPAEAGVIKRVVVENFMCHQKLKVDLCRNINFIHGQNGSGKSAILAAIQICLGANARRTHRARNLKDLVRKEAASSTSCAKVSVTLLNGGEDGYKPELYGDRITVERTISLRSGGFNGYKLFNAQGKLVTNKKCDLDDMLDFLNIQVDNPVAILDQEEAKKFLTGKASDKHEFFMKATELQRIDRVFATIHDRAEELEGQKARLADAMARKKELVKTLKKKVEEFRAVEILEEKRLKAEIEYAWAFYAERNGDYEEAAEKLEAIQKKFDGKQEELTQAEEKASGANDDDEETRIRSKMDELQKEANSQKQLKRDLDAEVKLAKEPIKKAQREMKKLEGEEATANQSLNRAKKRLKEARDEILSKEGSAESEQARRTAQLNDAEEALARAKAKTPKIHEAVSHAYRDCEEQEPQFQQAKQAVVAKDKQCYAVKAKLRELSSSESNDAAAVFGRKCSEMVKLVEKARRNNVFRGEVIGPIGVFLKVAPGKEKYAELAELAIGHQTLDRFIVTNDHDRKQFQKLRDQLKCFKECNLFQVTASRRFDIPPPPAAEIETIASVLTVSNDIVFNCLVDNVRIDQRALAPSKEVSEQHLLVQEPNGRYRIKGNISEVAFLPRGDTWTVRGGAISLSSSRKKGGKKIGVDRTEAIKETEAELRSLEDELKQLRAEEGDAKKEHHRLKVKWNEHNKAKRANQLEVQDLTRKKEEIQNEIDTTANTDIDTSELEKDVEDAEEALDKIREVQASINDEIKGLMPAVEDAKNKLEEVKSRNDKVIKDMKDTEEELEACIARQTQSDQELEKKRAKVQKYKEALDSNRKKVDSERTAREDALRGARKLTLRLRQKEKQQQGQEEGAAEGGQQSASQNMSQDFTKEELEQVEILEVAKDSDSYSAKLKRLKDKIQKERGRRDLSNEDPTVAIEKHLKAQQDLQETQDGYNEADQLYQQTRQDLVARKKRWAKLRKYLQKMTDSRFDSILRLNQACGELEFDNENNELNLVVQKNVNDEGSQTKDVKALSGGERSFTTISLLLALGESLETPFRVLDEFDVFLDPQTRKLTINTLIHVAKKMNHRQFIFITPQDLSSVKPDDKVKIFKLKAPERNQRAGGLTQQTLDFSQG